jgi:DNA invertase Pin-like site-specific DNA recombinase
MLIVETIGRIRREHLVKGKSIKEIARNLKISRNTVRKILRSGGHRFPTNGKFNLDPGSVAGRPNSTGC